MPFCPVPRKRDHVPRKAGKGASPGKGKRPKWWRRGESNSRPKTLRACFYVRIPPLVLARRRNRGRARRSASPLFFLALRPGDPESVASPRSSPGSVPRAGTAGRRGIYAARAKSSLAFVCFPG